MTDLYLTQAEADALIAMEKLRIDDQLWDYPGLGGTLSIPLVSSDKRENFLLDMSRGRINLLRGKYQNRARQALVLVRLDFGGPPHRNPDGEEIASPHLHLYRQGYGDKWAEPVPQEVFANMEDLFKTLEDFMRFCNICEPPNIQRGLFT